MTDPTHTPACAACAEDLVAFLDRELDAEAGERVRSHLDACPRCAGQARALSRTWQLMDAYAGITASPSFLSRLATQLSSAPEPIVVRPTLLRAVLPRLASAAALLALLGAGYLAWTRIGPGGPAEPVEPTAALSEEDRALLADLGILSEPSFEVVRDMPLVEQYPVLEQLSESDLGSM